MANTPEELWFRQPSEGITHIAWQVGHLATSQYLLCCVRMRGRRSEDEAIVAKDFLRLFMKGTTPLAGEASYPSTQVISNTLDAVHELAMMELPEYAAEQLAESSPEPYVATPNKLGSLRFCAMHEMLHAGQIGLLRRLLGLTPVR